MSNLEGEQGTFAVTFRHRRLWPWVTAAIGLGIGYRSLLTSGVRRVSDRHGAMERHFWRFCSGGNLIRNPQDEYNWIMLFARRWRTINSIPQNSAGFVD